MNRLYLKKAAILSDIHGNIPALESVVADIKQRKIDHVFNLGDHLSGPLWPCETAQFLMKQEWIQIAGNHDRQLIQQDISIHSPSDQYAYQMIGEAEIRWLQSLPATFTYDDFFFMFHGSPTDDSVYFLEKVENGRSRLSDPQEITGRLGNCNAKIIFCGHSHIQRVVNVSDTLLIINPGSVGLQAYDDVAPEYHIMETGSPHARYAILSIDENIYSVDLVSITYDHITAAKQAAKNNRPDWERGLLTGFFSI